MVEAEPAEEKDAAEDRGGYPYPYGHLPDRGSEETREIVNPETKEPRPDSAPHNVKEWMNHHLFPRDRPMASHPL
jgi:hypothetical protein